MAWCPNCRNEYVEGIFVCADCKTELVEDLTEYENIQQENNVPQQEAFEPTIEDIEEAVEQKEKLKNIKTFVRKEEKAQEHKSSALTLIIVGVLGIVAIVLYWLGIIPLYLNETSKYMITIVMGGTFILFIAIGLQTAHSVKQLQKEGEEENRLEQEIFSYCRSLMQADVIDGMILETQETEEMKYFKRIDIMKQMISERFFDVEEEFAEYIADELYAEIFG